MTPNQMWVKLDGGEKSLDLSIEKWHDIVYHDGADYGCRNCALCSKHHHAGTCIGCIIKAKTKRAICADTPYTAWDDHQDKEHKDWGGKKVYCSKCKELAVEMLEFLESLRKPASKIQKIRDSMKALGEEYRNIEVSAYNRLQIHPHGIQAVTINSKLQGVIFLDEEAIALRDALNELYKEER